jgi:hypothetical protein
LKIKEKIIQIQDQYPEEGQDLDQGQDQDLDQGLDHIPQFQNQGRDHFL